VVARTDHSIIGTSSRRRQRGVANLEIAKPQVFDGIPSKVLGFMTVCKLYGKAKIREVPVEEQIQWVLSYI